MNFQTICRICMMENSEMISIFDSCNFSTCNCEIFKVITDCASVQIRKFDGFSEQICPKCFSQLSQAYGFKRLCEDSDYKFRNNLIVREKFEIKDDFSEEDTKITYGEINKRITENVYEISKIIDKHEIKSENNSDKIQYGTHEVDSATYCGDVFEPMEYNALHIQSVINDSSPEPELCCESTFFPLLESSKNLFTDCSPKSEHTRLHTGEKPYMCDTCGKKFTRKEGLKQHIRCHTGEKPYNCEFCGKKFSVNSALTNHIRVHTGEKPYQCETCDKNFAQKTQLVCHRRTHSGEKQYQCDLCEKKFLEKSHLKNHIRVHTGEKQYKCDICNKKFAQKAHVVSHNKIHTGEKPYKCDICEKKFSQNSDLKRHIKVHTRIKYYTIRN